MPIATVNPATGEVLETFEPLSDEQIDRKLQLATDAFRAYRKTSFAERREKMLRTAEVLESRREELGRIITTEMGKTLRSAVAEVEKSAWGCRYYAEHAEGFLADEVIETNARKSYVRYQPLGPVLAVMPWNFPFWQVFRFAAPALMAGNVGLLKHASNVPQCALAIEEVFREAGFPEGVFQTLLIGSDRVERVLSDPRVVAATLTGSDAAGSRVASQAGRLIKTTVLELGGSDPYVVTPSAHLDAAVKTAVQARNQNNGQSCIAAKRFIVFDQIADEFERRFAEQVGTLRVGDPMDDSTDVGPLAMEQIVRGVDEQVRSSVRMGARVLIGGRRLDRPGFYYEPTVLARVPDGAPARCEEIFGPVASVFRVKDLDEAIALANDTKYGLGASVWTSDEAERQRFVDEIEAGMVFVNGMVASDPRLPFGGVKASGYGRELSELGIREFVNAKTVWIG